MKLKRYFGTHNQAIFLYCDGVLRIGSETLHIAFSVISTKNLIDFLQELTFFFDTNAEPVENRIVRGDEIISVVGQINEGTRIISITQQVKDVVTIKISFHNSFEVAEFQDALCSLSLHCVAPTLFQYVNLIRFFKELIQEEDSLPKFNGWVTSDISDSSDWKNNIIKKILPNDSLKQEELCLLICMNMEFMQSYYRMFYIMFRE